MQPKHMRHETLSRTTLWTMGALGALSLTLLFICKKDAYDAPEMRITRSQAIALAKQRLPEDFIFAQQYDTLTQLYATVTPAHIFVWQTNDKETYQRLMGTYLSTPFWNVRFVSFKAPQELRAEEYQIMIDTNGTVFRTAHILPENKKLASLNKAQARGIALKTLQDRYSINATEVEEISAQPTEKPNRTDWAFTFKHLPTVLKEGYAELTVIINGSIVADCKRSVFIPESWQRAFMHKESVKVNVIMVCSFLFVLLIILAISSFGTAFVRHLKTKPFIIFSLILFGLACLELINRTPAITGLFSTAQPFATQLFGIVFGALMFSLIRIMLVSVYTVHMRSFLSPSQLIYPGIFFIGLVGGLILRSAYVLGKWIVPVNVPVWGSYEFMASYSALFMLTITYTFIILRNITFGTIAVSSLNSLQENIRSKLFRFLFIFVAAYASIGVFESIASGISIGLCITIATLILYNLLLAYDCTLWIPILSGYFLTYALSEYTAQVFPGYGVSMAAIGLLLTSINYWWFCKLRKNT